MPLVINGKPGIINNMEQMYPASWTAGTWKKISAAFKQMAYIRQAAEIETAIFKNSVK